ncbi:unnamed protein product [Larinioides sclopetarius]|uniref:Uncharacterized protein n=1 Tax=Larinioides sclopetarius TaxID=280406 RepID=A0AAV1Z648_9ARAC
MANVEESVSFVAPLQTEIVGAIGDFNALLPDLGLLSIISNLKCSNCVDFSEKFSKICKLSRLSKEQMYMIVGMRVKGPARKFYKSSLRRTDLNYGTSSVVEGMSRRVLFFYLWVICKVFLRYPGQDLATNW